jgi:hypothetical protein
MDELSNRQTEFKRRIANREIREETSGAQLFPSIGFKIDVSWTTEGGNSVENAWGWQSRKPAK